MCEWWRGTKASFSLTRRHEMVESWEIRGAFILIPSGKCHRAISAARELVHNCRYKSKCSTMLDFPLQCNTTSAYQWSHVAIKNANVTGKACSEALTFWPTQRPTCVSTTFQFMTRPSPTMFLLADCTHDIPWWNQPHFGKCIIPSDRASSRWGNELPYDFCSPQNAGERW